MGTFIFGGVVLLAIAMFGAVIVGLILRFTDRIGLTSNTSD